MEGRKPENPEKNPWSTGENQQTQLTYDAGSGNRTRDHSDERRGMFRSDLTSLGSISSFTRASFFIMATLWANLQVEIDSWREANESGHIRQKAGTHVATVHVVTNCNRDDRWCNKIMDQLSFLSVQTCYWRFLKVTWCGLSLESRCYLFSLV